ncbi:hypothetical protein NON20_24515 (plasmid) [Synechocystis sp. B12]|nr:hypothetical protein NON20_24515 [Synechocystis sp. B12]
MPVKIMILAREMNTPLPIAACLDITVIGSPIPIGESHAQHPTIGYGAAIAIGFSADWARIVAAGGL